MILLAKKRLIIPAKTSRVFRYVSDMENYGSWFPGVIQIRPGNPLEPLRLGKTYLEKLILPQGEVNLTIEVTRCQEDKRFETKGDLQPILPGMTMEFEATQNHQCDFCLAYYSRNPELGDTHPLIKGLKQDLGTRIEVAMGNLLNWAEKNEGV